MATVSLCMIVKNEEKVLRRCLDSLAGLYEELVIVDTGSTDSTKEITMIHPMSRVRSFLQPTRYSPPTIPSKKMTSSSKTSQGSRLMLMRMSLAIRSPPEAVADIVVLSYPAVKVKEGGASAPFPGKPAKRSSPDAGSAL